MRTRLPAQICMHEMRNVLALDAAEMATGVNIHSSGDDADGGSETSSIYSSYSSDNDSMDFEEGYDAAGCSSTTAARCKTLSLSSGDAEVGINMTLKNKCTYRKCCKKLN